MIKLDIDMIEIKSTVVRARVGSTIENAVAHAIAFSIVKNIPVELTFNQYIIKIDPKSIIQTIIEDATSSNT